MTGFVQEDANRAEVAALLEAAVAERCAPLVEALERVAANSTEPWAQQIADDALAAYHAAQGAGRGT